MDMNLKKSTPIMHTNLYTLAFDTEVVQEKYKNILNPHENAYGDKWQ